MNKFRFLLVLFVWWIFLGCNNKVSICGNGIIEPGEECDGFDLNDLTCFEFGYYPNGFLQCDDSCHIDTTGCIDAEVCGNGVIESGEECDGDDWIDVDCTNYGYYGPGHLTCTDTCKIDKSTCLSEGYCGDGIINGDEVCDGTDVSPEVCKNAGLWYGICKHACTLGSVCHYSVQWGSASSDYARNSTLDNEDNIYVVGETEGGIDGNTFHGGYDVFLTKYDNNGIKKWTRQWGTNTVDYGESVAADNMGNVYVTGETLGSLDGNVNSGDQDVYLTKYTSDGTKLWTKQWGTEAMEFATTIVSDNMGNVYVSGVTYGSMDGNANSGDKDVYLTKYTSDGTKLWTKQWGTEAGEFLTSSTIDASGYLYVTGETAGVMDINNVNGDDSSYDMFLTKYTLDGTKLWTRQWGTDKSDWGESVVTDNAGNVYIAGRTWGSLSDDNDFSDICLTKYTSDGTKLWMRQWGTEVLDYGLSVAVDSNGYIYVTGYTEGALDGNSYRGREDVYLTKYNPDGTKLWTKQWGTYLSDRANSVVIDSNDGIYISGTTGRYFEDAFMAVGEDDVFIIRTTPEAP